MVFSFERCAIRAAYTPLEIAACYVEAFPRRERVGLITLTFGERGNHRLLVQQGSLEARSVLFAPYLDRRLLALVATLGLDHDFCGSWRCRPS